ncbi:MAG TPA: DJ-1/PfpI family protein [Sporolactobacillaceae bacterium]|nr:DJ-1/PfpI family protein [Sporolactobacillaceae bacterium]
MKVLFFLYDNYAEFEISILNTVLRGSDVEVVTCSPKPVGSYVISSGGLQIVPHYHMDELDLTQYKALIIPGGRPHVLLGNEAIQAFMKRAAASGVYMAAICAGPSLLADAGLLRNRIYTTSLSEGEENYTKAPFQWKNKQQEFVVTDQNVTTATGSAYVEFAEEVLRQLGVCESNEQNPLAYFKTPSMM